MILVTGGAGYIGSHCVLGLISQGYDVIVLDNLSTGNKEQIRYLSSLTFKGKIIDFIEGDISDRTVLDDIFGNYHIDAVIHTAAYSQVGESVENPSKYHINNVLGTRSLLESMNANNIKKLVFSSSASVYGEPKYVPIDEKHPCNPTNPYGETKMTIEADIDTEYRSHGLNSVCLRFFNVIGADSQGRIGEMHNPETHLIPNILKSTFENSKDFQIFGTDYDTKDGTCIRDYVNVEDVIDAHILALRYLDRNDGSVRLNLGTGTGYSVKDIFAECERVTGKKIPVTEKDRRTGDPVVLVADISMAKRVLGWEPKRSLADSIYSAYVWERRLYLDNMQ